MLSTAVIAGHLHHVLVLVPYEYVQQEQSYGTFFFQTPTRFSDPCDYIPRLSTPSTAAGASLGCIIAFRARRTAQTAHLASSPLQFTGAALCAVAGISANIPPRQKSHTSSNKTPNTYIAQTPTTPRSRNVTKRSLTET